MVSVKKIVMVTLVAVTMLGLGGLFPHAEASKLDEVQSRGCLLVGTTGDYKPMSYLNRETGRYEGFDTEASELLAQSLGGTGEVYTNYLEHVDCRYFSW